MLPSALLAAAAAKTCGSVAAGKNFGPFRRLLTILHDLSILGRFRAFLEILECSWNIFRRFTAII